MSGFKPRTGFILFFILVFGFMLRLDNLSGRSLWTDEFFTLFQSSGHGLDVRAFDDSIAAMDTPPLLKPSDLRLFIGKDPGKGVRDVTTGLLKTDTHPPLYFWVVHAWMIMFGDSVFALRFFSLLLGVLSIFLAYKLGGRLFGRQAGIFCSLFTALSPFSIRYSQEARAYSLIMAIGLVSSLLLLRIERDNRNSDAFYFSLATAIGLYTHYFYAFLALAQFFYFSVAHFRDDRRLRKFYLSALGALLLFSPWLAYLFLNGYNFPDAEWIFGYPGIIGKISGIFPGMMGYFLVPGGTGLPWVLFVLSGSLSFVYIVIRELRDVFSGYRRQIFFCLSVLVMPLLIMLLLDIFQHGVLLRQERFWVFSFIGFIPLAGYFLKSGFSRHKIAFVILFICMLVSSFLANKVQFGPAPGSICRWLNAQAQGKRSAVVVCNKRGAIFPQSYYLDDDIHIMPVSSEEQLINGIKAVSGKLDQIFIVRHYHLTDNSLLNEPFMERYYIGKEFIFEGEATSGNISASKFVKRTI